MTPARSPAPRRLPILAPLLVPELKRFGSREEATAAFHEAWILLRGSAWADRLTLLDLTGRILPGLIAIAAATAMLIGGDPGVFLMTCIITAIVQVAFARRLHSLVRSYRIVLRYVLHNSGQRVCLNCGRVVAQPEFETCPRCRSPWSDVQTARLLQQLGVAADPTVKARLLQFPTFLAALEALRDSRKAHRESGKVYQPAIAWLCLPLVPLGIWLVMDDPILGIITAGLPMACVITLVILQDRERNRFLGRNLCFRLAEHGRLICADCDYDMAVLRDNVCPECGHDVPVMQRDAWKRYTERAPGDSHT